MSEVNDWAVFKRHQVRDSTQKSNLDFIQYCRRQETIIRYRISCRIHDINKAYTYIKSRVFESLVLLSTLLWYPFYGQLFIIALLNTNSQRFYNISRNQENILVCSSSSETKPESLTFSIFYTKVCLTWGETVTFKNYNMASFRNDPPIDLAHIPMIFFSLWGLFWKQVRLQRWLISHPLKSNLLTSVSFI